MLFAVSWIRLGSEETMETDNNLNGAEEIGISENALRDLVNLFVDTTGHDLSALGAAMEGGNRTGARSLFHHIRGAAEVLCFDDIVSELAVLRKHWESGEEEKRKESMNRLESMVKEKRN